MSLTVRPTSKLSVPKVTRLGVLGLSLLVLTTSTGCNSNPQQMAAALAAIARVFQGGLGSSSMAPTGTFTPGSFSGVPVSTSSLFPGSSPTSSIGPVAKAPTNGGLPFPWDGGIQPGRNSPDGVLDLPIMRQGDGGSEAAIRGCGPTSLLMATGHGNPGQIQGVLEQVCARPGGLIAERAVDWLHQKGYRNSLHQEGWTVERLREETMVRRNPVLVNFINPKSGNGHIVVVTGVTDQGVHINDPGPGAKRVLSVSQFEQQWAGRSEYAIPVRA